MVEEGFFLDVLDQDGRPVYEQAWARRMEWSSLGAVRLDVAGCVPIFPVEPEAVPRPCPE